MLKMKKTEIFTRAVLAGAMIAIGGTVYLSSKNRVVGALLFTIGLFFVVTFGLNLFTGKVGYAIFNGAKYIHRLFIITIGNFIGTFTVAILLRLAQMTPQAEKALEYANIKLDSNLLRVFITAMFCGVLMYLAVEGYNRIKDNVGKYLAVFFGVSVFIISGFEHSIANMFYFSLAGAWSLPAVLHTILAILGNAAGAMIFAYFTKEEKE